MTTQPTDLYPSRVGGTSALRERLDPVVYGPANSALTDPERECYRRDGFLPLNDLLNPVEVGHLLFELRTLAARDTERPEVILEPESKAVRSVFNVHQQSSRVMRLLQSERVLPIVEELLGSEVYIHQSRVNFKPAFEGREFYWHSDFETWHVEDGMPRIRALSLSINLTDNTAVNGPLMVMAGSHQHYVSCAGYTPADHHTQSLRRQEYGVPTREQLTWLASCGETLAMTGKEGSAVLFDCNLMHGSAANMTPHPRANLFVVFNSVNNKLLAPYSGQPPRPEHIASRDFAPITAP